MMDERKLCRMTQLKVKEQTEGLDAAELAEQKLLRIEYLSGCESKMKKSIEYTEKLCKEKSSR